MKQRVFSKKRTIVNMLLAPLAYYVIGQAVVFIACIVVAAQLTVQGVAQSELLTQTQDAVYNANVLLTMIASLITLPIVYFLLYERKNKIGQRKTDLRILLLIPFGAAACVTDNLLISLTHLSDYFPQYEELAETIYQGNLWFELFAVALLPGILEELIYRGVLYKGFRRFVPPVWAGILSALIFGIMHMNVVQFVYAAILGLLFVWVYEAFQTIWAPMLMHISANAFSVLMTEWAPLGDALETTGGTFAMLGLTLLFDIAAPVMLVRMLKKRKATS